MSRHFLIVFAAAMACVGSFVSSAVRADEGKLIRADLLACFHDSTVLGGVNQCGKIWKLGEGEVSLSKNGQLKVEVKHLVLNDPSTGSFNGTPDGVTGIVAALICGGSGGTVVAQTTGVPLSQAGNAKISATVTLPARCVAPIVVVREIFDGAVGGWLAAAGF